MDDTIDLLKIKIEKAKADLSKETINAINAVDWKAAILGLRAKKGYTFEQLGDLELETELLLSGLVSPENYPKELEKRMKISKASANEIVNEMNSLVFKKIQEELIKNAERKKIFQKSERSEKNDTQALNSAGIEIIPDLPAVGETQLMQAGKLELTSGEKPTPARNASSFADAGEEKREDILKTIEKPEPARPLDLSGAGGEVHPILAEKLSGPVQIGMVKTDHSLSNLSSGKKPSLVKKIDPLRGIPE